MTDFTCPECNGTGVYQGLNTVEPCRSCGGKRMLSVGDPFPNDIAGLRVASIGTPSPDGTYDINYACQQSIGKSVIEYAAEQAGIEIPIQNTRYWRDTAFIIEQLQKAFGKIAPSTIDACCTLAAHWSCDLNGWEWPKEWGEPPEWINEKYALSGRACYEHEKERYASLISSVHSFTTHRERFRVHNVERRKAMTESEFETWYATAFSPTYWTATYLPEPSKPFDEIMPAELECITEGQFVNVEFECERFLRAYQTLNRIIDRPLFGLPSKAFQMVHIKPGFNKNGNRIGRLKLVRLYGNAIGDSDPCQDMLFIPILED